MTAAVTLIGAPTDVGAGARGASMGPEALRVANLGPVLAAHGLDADVPVLMDGGAALSDPGVLAGWVTGPQPVTAVVTGNNRSSRKLLYALDRQPDITLAYVCFDEWEMADLMRPAVTTVDQNAAAIGRVATEVLLSRIAGADGPPRHTVVPTTLTVRRSSGLVMRPL